MVFFRYPTKHCRLRRGFTLIELMIVVAIVALLAGVALPSFLDSVRKSRRSDAIAELAKVQQAEERWRSNNTTYNSADASSASTGLGLVSGTTASTSYTTSSGYYTIAINAAAASATSYTIRAAGLGSQASDTNCQYLQIAMSSGTLTYASGPTSAVGNGAAANNACWKR